MKISIKNLVDFSNLGTIVLYRERKFYPWDYTKSSKEEREEMFESSKADQYLYKSSLPSNLSDFSMYDFYYDLRDEKKYSPVLIPAELDDYSVTTLGEDIDRLSSLIIPQKSTEDVHTGAGYFGSLTTMEGTPISLIEVPEDIWKIEIYNDKLEGNSLLNGNQEWIDYDILTRFPEEIVVLGVPCIQIYLGPQYDTQIEGEAAGSAFSRELYQSRYFDPEQSSLEYPSFTNQLSFPDYKKSYLNEVKGKKVLILAYSEENELKINLINPSKLVSNNVLRNRNKISERVDDYKIISESPLYQCENLSIDKRSGVLLGNVETDFKIDTPIFYEKLITANHYSSHCKKTQAIIDNKEFYSGKTHEITENPFLSPAWSLKRNLPNDYVKIYISKNEGGSLSKSGVTYIKKGQDLKIESTTEIGFKLDSTSITPATYTEPIKGTYIFPGSTIQEGTIITFKFLASDYELCITFQCDEDYTKEGSYTEQTIQEIMDLLPIYLDGALFDGERLSPTKVYKLVLDFDNSPYSLIRLIDSEGNPVDLSKSLNVESLFPDNEQYTINLRAFIEVKDILVKIVSSNGIQLKEHSLTVRYNTTGSFEFYSESPCTVTSIGEITGKISYLTPEDLGEGLYLVTIPNIKENCIINIEN